MGLAVTLLAAKPAMAHHGGVSAAFGPGSPVETTAPLTLPEGSWLLFDRFEVASYRKYSKDEPENISRFTFNTAMLGYGLRNDLSVYISMPYVIKKQDTVGTSKGFGDLGVLFQYGFKYGVKNGITGWYAYDKKDTVGSEQTRSDYKFTLFGGFSVPTGTINNRGNDLDGDGVKDTLGLGMQPGFAVPTYNAGIAASKLIFAHVTLTADASFKAFSLSSGPGEGKPGNEVRANMALGYELFEAKNAFLSRVDLIGEANFLHLDKDLDENRVADDATGGAILYLSPAVRMTFYNKYSIATMVKLPTWTNLNKSDDQQGAEGLEKYRLIVSASMSF